MRENRTHGSEGGESGSTGLPYPYESGIAPAIQSGVGHSGHRKTGGLGLQVKNGPRLERICNLRLAPSAHMRQ